MYPKEHVLLGVVFTFVMWVLVPDTPWFYLALVLFTSILIDFDHYIVKKLQKIIDYKFEIDLLTQILFQNYKLLLNSFSITLTS